MKPKHIFLLFLLISSLSSSSCSKIFLGIYGIQMPKTVTDKTIIRAAKKYKIPVTECYELMPSYREFVLYYGDRGNKQAMKNHLQPLQAIYYNANGDMISFHINCNAGGYPNLKWNRNGNMTCFPPKQQTQIDSLATITQQYQLLLPLGEGTKIEMENDGQTLIVFWTKFMGRQTKRFIRIIQENAKLATGDLKIVYVNADNLFVETGEEIEMMDLGHHFQCDHKAFQIQALFRRY